MHAGGAQDGMDIGAYVHLYGHEFVHTDVRLALEYYLAAARVQVMPAHTWTRPSIECYLAGEVHIYLSQHRVLYGLWGMWDVIS